jgi:hypothetical protein
LATHQSRLAQATPGHLHRDVLRYLVTTGAPWTGQRLCVTFHDCRAGDRKRAVGRSSNLQLKESFPSVEQFRQGSLCFSALGTSSRLLGHRSAEV